MILSSLRERPRVRCYDSPAPRREPPLDSFVLSEPGPTECPTCEGDGKCDPCYGKGYLMGGFLCPWCGGSGKCYRCGGAGTIAAAPGFILVAIWSPVFVAVGAAGERAATGCGSISYGIT